MLGVRFWVSWRLIDQIMGHSLKVLSHYQDDVNLVNVMHSKIVQLSWADLAELPADSHRKEEINPRRDSEPSGRLGVTSQLLS